MGRYLIVSLLVLFSLISFVPTIVQAQEEEETEYSWGTVTSVSSNQIVITEYDYNSDEESDVAYTLAPYVKLDNVNSLKDIAIGDEVWVDYVVTEGKKVAVSIEVKESSDEEYTPSFEEESDTSEEQYQYPEGRI